MFFRDCDNCQIFVPCNQFRCRDLYNSSIYLFCETDPVIESSDGLLFAPYNLAYPLQDQHIEASGLNIEHNKWDLIFDFTDTNESGEKASHYQLLDPNEFRTIEQYVDGVDDEPVLAFPLPRSYGGTLEDNVHTHKEEGTTFDIRTTTAADAQKIYDEQQRRQAAMEQEQQEQQEHEEQPVEHEEQDEQVEEAQDFQQPTGFESNGKSRHKLT